MIPVPFVYRFGKRTYDLSARPHIMGVLNVTPDSFSDGGRYNDADRAVERALVMVEEGADFIDIGGESTRPKGAYGEGADPVGVTVELARVIERLAAETDVPLSIDTYKAEVARQALAAGASIVNDISGFRFDPEMPAVVAGGGGSAVLMHIKGTPKTMQSSPAYEDLFGEILGYLREAVELGARAGIRQMLVDPGIGFGKNLSDNLKLIANLQRFSSIGYPICVGPSRKSFIGMTLGLPIEERLEGTLAAVTVAVLQGAHVLRLHDVKEGRRAALMAAALR
jgi:dihydropteroate synthase